MNTESNSGYDCPVKINKIYNHSLYVKAHEYLCTFHGTHPHSVFPELSYLLHLTRLA